MQSQTTVTEVKEKKSLYVKRGKQFVKIGEVDADDPRHMSVSEYYEWLTGHAPAEYDSIEDMNRYFKAVC